MTQVAATAPDSWLIAAADSISLALIGGRDGCATAARTASALPKAVLYCILPRTMVTFAAGGAPRAASFAATPGYTFKKSPLMRMACR